MSHEAYLLPRITLGWKEELVRARVSRVPSLLSGQYCIGRRIVTREVSTVHL